jgi:hypothetical protein
MVEERYTASVLLGMSQTTYDEASGEKITIKAPTSICGNAYAEATAENGWFNEGSGVATSPTQKRVRRRGRYSPQERERIRCVMSPVRLIYGYRGYVLST